MFIKYRTQHALSALLAMGYENWKYCSGENDNKLFKNDSFWLIKEALIYQYINGIPIEKIHYQSPTYSNKCKIFDVITQKHYLK